MCVYGVWGGGEGEVRFIWKIFWWDKVGCFFIFFDVKCLYIINSLIYVVYIENENFGVRGLSN